MDALINLPEYKNEASGTIWRTCRLCGAADTKVCIMFSSGSVEPQVDETLTGATSGYTAVVEGVELDSGTWAGGDAAGQVMCSAPSDYDFDTKRWGSEDENINGSVGGNNIMTVDGYGYIKRFGRYYSEDQMTQGDDGFWYCNAHASFRFDPRDKRDEEIDIDDDNRNEA